jgi:hypothetical protein
MGILLTQLHTDFPSCRVILLGVETPSTCGGLGHDYASSGFWTYYPLLRKVNGLRLAEQTFALTAPFSTYCIYADVAAQFDAENNMMMTATPVNIRSSTTELRGFNGIHPTSVGYLQIADTAFRAMLRLWQ